LKEYEECYTNKEILKQLRPMTLEGCVVRISDIVGYIGRDIEDAVRLGVFDKKLLPKEITDTLGSDNRTIVNTIVLDIISNSLDKPYIKMSPKVYEAVKALKKFNSIHIYAKANTKEQIEEYKKMFRLLFHTYKKEIMEHDSTSKIYKVFLSDKDPSYLKNSTPSRLAIDYIAGMTDDYFVNEYKRIHK
jgi:dGTPase